MRFTPWKAENIWQLYMSASNFLDRSVDEIRYHAATDPALINRIVALVPDRAEELRVFLEGLPQRFIYRPAFRSRSAATSAWRSSFEKEPVQLGFAPCGN